jgi:DNA-binding NarL/FixJ family response regulator
MDLALIEDNTKYRESLAIGLNTFDDCNVIHQLHNALNVEKYFAQQLPNVAIVDINMPGINGVDCIKEITEKFPTVLCIMLTVNVDLDMVLKCMQHGAKGYLVKDKDSLIKIVESIRTLLSGNYNEEFPLNGTLANKILQHFSHNQKTLQQKLDEFNLTERQAEILQLLYNGKSYKQIAGECGISIDTLNSHVKAIYPKLKIRSRGEIRGVLE